MPGHSTLNDVRNGMRTCTNLSGVGGRRGKIFRFCVAPVFRVRFSVIAERYRLYRYNTYDFEVKTITERVTQNSAQW